MLSHAKIFGKFVGFFFVLLWFLMTLASSWKTVIPPSQYPLWLPISNAKASHCDGGFLVVSGVYCEGLVIRDNF